jgi:dimethylglycine dehydrogenase
VAEKAAGSPWRFVPLTLDDPGEADAPFCASVFDGDERVGLVTSGGWSFTLGQSVALAYVRPALAAPGTRLSIGIFGERVAATVGSEPLFDPGNDRLRA